MRDFKKIGIIGAMDEEIEAIIASMREKGSVETRVSTFYQDDSLVVCRCGIGKVNAAACTQAMIDTFEVDAIINVGIAGSIGEGVCIGDVVVATELIEHDFDATGVGLKRGEIPRMKTSTFSCDDRLVYAAREGSLSVLGDKKVHLGTIVSGDEFVSSSQKKKDLRATFNALAAEMEGAAIAHVCYVNEIPFLVIRAISDNASDDANSEYYDNDLESIDITGPILFEILRNLE